MAKAKPDRQKVKAYRVARHQCVHGGVVYAVGDILPDLPLEALNVHLPNLELVEVEDCPSGKCPMPAVEVVELIDQFEESPVYEV